MSYKNYKWEIVAHDFNSYFIRNYLFIRAFIWYKEIWDIPKVGLGIISRKDEIEYLADFSTWAEAHNALKERALKDYHFVEALLDRSMEYGEELNKWTEENIFNVDLTVLDGKRLVVLLKQFMDNMSREYTYGTVTSILDFQAFSFVEGNLIKFLKSKVPEKEFQKYYAVFTEPPHNSFAQDQEEDLLRLMEEFYNNTQLMNDIKTKTEDEIKDKYSEFYSKLQEHAKKYAWVYYVYAGPAFTEKDFLDFIKDYLTKDVNPGARLKELEEHKQEIKSLKQEYIEKLQPDEFNLAMINMAGKIVWAKPRRKDYQSKSYYHAEKLMREIGKRLFISLEQVRSAPLEILEKALSGGELDVDKINEIYKFHVCVPNKDGTISVLTGKEAQDLSDNYVQRGEKEDFSKIKEIKGTCACEGKAKGTVKIVNQPSDMGKMNYGDILISTATTPSVVPAMRKAAAIITDEGGLTCHAAIVSREMNIPCIVGTKIITKALKDGDLVEVDAIKGIVKKIEK
jgi:phosphohistidine swiveling domain-containing protein